MVFQENQVGNLAFSPMPEDVLGRIERVFLVVVSEFLGLPKHFPWSSHPAARSGHWVICLQTSEPPGNRLLASDLTSRKPRGWCYQEGLDAHGTAHTLLEMLLSEPMGKMVFYLMECKQ